MAPNPPQTPAERIETLLTRIDNWLVAERGPSSYNEASDLIVDILPELKRLTAAEQQLAEAKTLFTCDPFIAHGGQWLDWKIDCDALTEKEIVALSAMLRQILPPFCAVEGVPTGGERLAAALRPFVTVGSSLLIVDDVLTTGSSMEAHRAGREAIGAVLFARGPYPAWVTPLFVLFSVIEADATALRQERDRLASQVQHLLDTCVPVVELDEALALAYTDPRTQTRSWQAAYQDAHAGNVALTARIETSESQLAARDAEIVLLRKVLGALSEKLDEIVAHPSYKSVFGLAVVHGMGYDGPTFEREQIAARHVLASPSPADQEK